ncbi:hypothetical protein N1851_013945 [Merluccius polli]|uniref:CCHC-type domain-containing protein n=1 Tax=Merluccius polli TaxID=89951 RepID=A0AA47MU36_MERPO|nr:hypothetical protein N1851_013945 [Merluccius polli]
MQRQNEITYMLVQQQMSATLPQRDITIFAGDPLQFVSFMRTFEHCIEERTSSYQDCLYFLEQYTRGQPRELVQSCLHMIPQQGYQTAKYRIATAYMDKAFGWPVIKAEDVQALQEFALFLRGCCNAMTEIQYMEELNIPSHMRHVIMKLPYKLRERWRSTACDIQERRGYRATFLDIVCFLENQVKVLSHPLFGDISDARPNTLKAVNTIKSLPRSNSKGSSFAATIAATNHTVTTEPTAYQIPKQPMAAKELSSESCLYCQELHPLFKCSRLSKVSQREKIEFLRGKGVCFGCLQAGHMTKECRNRLTCEECNLKHPTILHIHNKDKLKSKKGGKVLQTYAFLDPGSTATFCTSRFLKKLNLQGKRTNILLRTMGQEKVVESQVITGLEVSKLDENQFVELPETYTQETIPVSKGNIPTQQDIEKWKYLNDIRIPELDAEVEILIGTNAPKLMEPWEVINSEGDGPYAVRTLLGWVVNGPLRGNSGCCQRSCSTVYANRISIVRLEELLVSQYNQDFNEKSLEEKQEMSREDLRFMKILEKSTCIQDGHYCMDLPFKVDDITMPNNRCIVEQRIQGLKRRFEKNKTYQEEYTRFLTDMINSGYAEVVPQNQLDGKDGSV